MTTLALLLALTAVLLAVPAPVGQRLLPGRPGPSRRSGLTGARAAGLWVVVLVVGPLLALVTSGPRTAAFSASGAILLGTAARLVRLRSRRVAARGAQAAVAEACALLAANLRAGMVPAQALTRAADTAPVLREAQRTLALGGDVTGSWRRQAQVEGWGGLADLSRAWQVGTRSGASLTGTLQQVAAGLEADVALRAVVGGELAAPRATGKVMAALPALGVAMGYLLGGDPLRWLAGGWTGWVCLVTGTALACAGVLWIEALARRAAAQG